MKYFVAKIAYNDGKLEDIIEVFTIISPSISSAYKYIMDELENMFCNSRLIKLDRVLYFVEFEDDIHIKIIKVEEITEEEYNILGRYNMKW